MIEDGTGGLTDEKTLLLIAVRVRVDAKNSERLQATLYQFHVLSRQEDTAPGLLEVKRLLRDDVVTSQVECQAAAPVPPAHVNLGIIGHSQGAFRILGENRLQRAIDVVAIDAVELRP